MPPVLALDNRWKRLEACRHSAGGVAMIRALVVGKIYGTPQVRTSATGNTFTTAKLKATGKDNETVWCSLIGFGEIGERLAILDEGASISVAGRAEVNAWINKNGEPHAGLGVLVDELATLKGRPRPKAPRKAKQAPTDAGVPFDDELPEFVP